MTQVTRLPKHLKPGHVRALLAAPTQLRDRVLLRLLYYGALRVSEVCGLRIEDVDVLERVLCVRHAETPHGRPKEQKERIVPIDPETVNMLVAYAGKRREGPFFTITIRQAQRVVKAAARAAGIPTWRRVTPHKLRHSFAVHWVKRGGDIERLRRILGHTQLDTTKIYLQFDFKDVQDEYDRVMGARVGRVRHVTLEELLEVLQRIEHRIGGLERV